ncbi:MAG: carbon-nitrogen family hydrolase [Verrucomicrobiae bacterium]|nr:carbon-nitrogen family hydrolase [Verrucomicrobiae bacterium]
MLRVIGFQYDVAWENRAANFGRLRQMLDEMDEPPAGSLLVLPEMFATGFSLNVEATAEAEPSETLAFMKELATKTRCVVLGGLVTRSEAACEMGRNELRVVEPDGGEIVRYQKVRTFRYTREFDHYERGTEVVTFDWGGLRICPLICYDLRFPELFRRGAAAGAEVFVVIASWPAVRADHWVTLLRARAIENLAWVVGVNRSGTDPNWDYPGRSVVIDPHGTIVADAGKGEGVVVADLDPEVVRSWRSEFPALKDLEI